MSDIKKVYNAIKGHLQGIEIQKESVKKKKDFLREKLAEIYDLRDKEDKPDLKKVKSNLLKKAIEFTRVGKNTLENDLDTMLIYAKSIKEKKVSEADINLLLILEEELKESKKEFNSYKKEILNEIDIIDFQALNMIITEELSKKGNSEYKNNEELLEKMKQIKEIIRS